MATTHDQFPTDTTGLPEARASEVIELGDGDRFDLTIAPVAKRIGDATGADARLQRLDSRADAQGARGLGGRRRHREPGRHGSNGPLARAAAGEPLRRNPRDPAADGRRRALHRARHLPRSRASTGTTRTSARTTGRRWACTATCSSSPPTRTTGRRCTARSPLTLDDILIEDGKVAPFSRAETTHSAMGRFGNVLLVGGETDLSLDRQARGGGAVLPDQHREHARVQGRAPGAQIKLVGGDSGHVEHEQFVDDVVLAPSERVVIDVLFDQPGELTMEHRTPGADLSTGVNPGWRGASRAIACRAVRGAENEPRHGGRA